MKGAQSVRDPTHFTKFGRCGPPIRPPQPANVSEERTPNHACLGKHTHTHTHTHTLAWHELMQ